MAGALETLIAVTALVELTGGALASLHLLLLRARPKTAFVFVLASFDQPDEPGSRAAS